MLVLSCTGSSLVDMLAFLMKFSISEFNSAYTSKYTQMPDFAVFLRIYGEHGFSSTKI